jgi:uncharacterized repeat protein (TIGR01451 family)
LQHKQAIAVCAKYRNVQRKGTTLIISPTRSAAATYVTRWILVLILIVLGLGLARNASAAIIINAPMTDTNSAGWVLGGGTILTGSGAVDPVGQGWLRLTNNTGNQTGYAYNTTPFNLSAGLLIEFDYSTWGGNGADGYSVFLFDANVGAFNIGAFGGSLGYAQKLTTSACGNPAPANVPGISGGYIGIGVDEYGNFADCGEGRYLSAYGNSNTVPNTVTVRGSVVGFGAGAVGQTLSTSSYPWIATSANNGQLWYNGSPRPAQTGPYYRKVRIQISPAPNPVTNVWIAYGYNNPLVYTPMITNQALPAISTSQQLMIGYAGSTGGSTNYHEIRNLIVTDQNTTSAIDLAITKTFTDITTGSTMTASAGDQVRYTIVASNTGPNNITATGVGIQDNIPAGITGVTWTCVGAGGATCAASGTGNSINTSANLPMNGYVTYTITGTVGAGAPSVLSNTASLIIPGSITDYNSNDDSATVTVAVPSDLSTSTKTWVDPNGGDQNPLDIIQYTITLHETAGGTASGVSVTDTFPAALTNLSVVPGGCPSGATCTIAGQTLTVSNAAVPANGTAVITVSSVIAGGTPVGTLIDNTATITNPGGPGAMPAAPTLMVSQSSVAQTGNKPLYLYDNTSIPQYQLSRTKPNGLTGAITLNARGGSQTWMLNPALASGVTTLGNNVTVNLWLANTSAATRNRNVEVRLACSSAPNVFATSGNLTLSLPPAGSPSSFPISLTGNLPMNCTSNNSWQLTVINQTAGNGRNAYVYPMIGTNNSYVDLPSQNVINVDSINAYNAAYPAVTVPVSGFYTSGQTVYVRTAVSDPFGAFDISSATISIKDSNNAIVSAATLTNIVTSTTGTNTYEYAFTIPAASPSGYWTVNVTANEGTEGMVSDLGTGTFRVGALPNIMVLKSVQVISDPVSGSTTTAKAIPGAVLEYSVTVTNSGTGVADGSSLVITDPIPTNTTMYVSTASGDPVTFSCSASPACGLTFTYGNDVKYTNTYPLPAVQTPPNGCGNFTYVPTGNYDANVKGLCINPEGTLNGGNASFTVKFRVQLN